ncbi:MAG: metalloregulator ArsR/SmtB family transcription factor [Pseudomonadales bacterium]|nr:metalloregulator ArsR/SmtB family transcription factor [Pseudomonadales bacterium]
MDESQQFAALGHPLRLQVFQLVIAHGEEGLPAGQIASTLDVPASTLSSHLKTLQQVNLLAATRDQQKLIYKINEAAVREMISFLVQDCCQNQPELCGLNIKT